MGKRQLSRIVAAYCILSMLPALVFADDQYDEKQDVAECRKRGRQLPCGPSSLTFYLHNTVFDVVANNTDYFTSVYGVLASYPFPNPNYFGSIATFEVPLTVEPSNTSQQMGIGQGFYLIDSMIDRTFFHVFTANITAGADIGSLSIMGQMRDINPVRYLSVVGGTGAFLGARGVAACRRVFIDRGPPARWTVSFDLDLYY